MISVGIEFSTELRPCCVLDHDKKQDSRYSYPCHLRFGIETSTIPAPTEIEVVMSFIQKRSRVGCFSRKIYCWNAEKQYDDHKAAKISTNSAVYFQPFLHRSGWSIWCVVGIMALCHAFDNFAMMSKFRPP